LRDLNLGERDGLRALVDRVVHVLLQHLVDIECERVREGTRDRARARERERDDVHILFHSSPAHERIYSVRERDSKRV
jgi:hypothetical protein